MSVYRAKKDAENSPDKFYPAELSKHFFFLIYFSTFKIEKNFCEESFRRRAPTFCDSIRSSAHKILREKFPNTELFLVCIFLYSEWISEIYFVNLCIQSKYRKILFTQWNGQAYVKNLVAFDQLTILWTLGIIGLILTHFSPMFHFLWLSDTLRRYRDEIFG